MAEFTVTTTYKVNCPDCDDAHVVKVGQRNGYQRYKCQGCDKRFRADGQAEGRKYDAELIGATVWDYYMGLSIKNLAQSIGYRYDIEEPSTATIYQWIKDHTEKGTYALRDTKAHTGDNWVADEMVMKVDGENVYHWNVMDKNTRYLLASHLARSRSAEEAIKVFQKALAKTDHAPKTITTDQYAAYPAVIRALRTVLPKTRHIQSAGIREFINNNLSERMQGTFRSREKTIRGMYTVESGQQFLDGFNLTYNYFRDHHSLKNRTPGEVAKVDMPFTEWADVVRADIEVPEPWKRNPYRRVPRVRIEGHTKRGYRKRNTRAPKPVLPEAGHTDRQLPMFSKNMMRGLRPKPPGRKCR